MSLVLNIPEGSCDDCKYHKRYFDTVGNSIHDDGCLCSHDKVIWEIHDKNCCHYLLNYENLELESCPYFEKEDN